MVWLILSTVVGLNSHNHGREASCATRWSPWRNSASTARISWAGLEDWDGLDEGGGVVVTGETEKAWYAMASKSPIACALVVQVLRNSIRETAALYGTFRWYSRRMFTPRTALYNFSINCAAGRSTRRARLQRLQQW